VAYAQPPANEKEVVAAEVRERETITEADHLTGDWGGWRTRLVDRGVHLQAGYIGEVLGNVSGGTRRGAIYEGLLELALELDLERMSLWNGGTFRISSLYPHGTAFSEKYLGDVLTASNIDAFDSFRLYQLWYEQKFANEKFSLRFGQLLADEEFTFTEPGSYFLNSAFGWPAFISANTVNTGPAFFVAAPGVRLRFQPDERFFVQAAIFDGDTFDSPTGDPHVNASGAHVHLSAEQGAFAIAEAGLRLNPGENNSGLPGEYKFGAWLHTAKFASNYEDSEGDAFIVSGRQPKNHSKNFGLYVAAQQMIWREEESQGVYLFARAGGGPRDRSFFEFVTDGGISYEGLFPGREDDVIGIAAAYARVSRDLRRTEKLDAVVNGTAYSGFSDHETVLEMFYAISLTKWCTVKPDFQWIFNPGAANAPDAVVIGVRTEIVF
jgi:porin